MKKIIVAVGCAVGAALVCPAESLVVDSSGLEVTNQGLAYEGITMHGNLTIGEGGAVTNTGTYFEIGPDVGDNATLCITNGG